MPEENISSKDQAALAGWLFRFMIYVDIFWCSVIWGDADVTISSVTGLRMRQPNPPWWARTLYAGLNRIQPNHCNLAIEGDTIRAIKALQLLGGHQ
jgi:hypothetical protein